jgi:membrane protein involved in colicin uptake
MGNLDRRYSEPSEYVSGEPHPIRPHERVVRHLGSTPSADMRAGNGAVIDLIFQASEMIKGIENQATEAEKRSDQQLQLERRRVEELETELRTAQLLINEARTKLMESDEFARAERARLEAAERRMADLEMRATAAEANAKENATAVVRIEEAIRTQLLAKRQPARRPALSA